MGRGGRCLTILGLGCGVGCLAPEVLQPDLSSPGTYLLVEINDEEARAEVIDQTPMVYARALGDSSLEVHRFSCPPGWYGFPKEGRIDVLSAEAVAESDRLAAPWPKMDDIQVLEGVGSGSERATWAFFPSLKTTSFDWEGDPPLERPISVYSGCTGSTIFFANGLGFRLSDQERIQTLAFGENVVATVPSSNGGRYWVMRIERPVVDEESPSGSPRMFDAHRLAAVIEGNSEEGFMGVQIVQSPSDALVRSSTVTLWWNALERGIAHPKPSANQPDGLPTISKTSSASFRVAFGYVKEAAVEIHRDTVMELGKSKEPIRHMARVGSQTFAVVDGKIDRFTEASSWALRPENVSCDLGGSFQPLSVFAFRGLLGVLRHEGIVLKSTLNSACRTARFEQSMDYPVVWVGAEHLIVWGGEKLVMLDGLLISGGM